MRSLSLILVHAKNERMVTRPLVSSVEEAVELHQQHPDCLLLGEVDGRPISGFDLPNSPCAVESLDLSSRRLIERTTAGTQGVVLSSRVDHLFAASLSVAAATAQRIRMLNPSTVTFVETGVRPKGGGEEDAACCDYIESVLLDTTLPVEEIRRCVLESRAGAKFTGGQNDDFPKADLDCALKIDKFPFAMQVERRDGSLVMRCVRSTTLADCNE